MAASALFIEIVGVLVDAARPLELLPGVGVALKRLHQRGVALIAVSDRFDFTTEAANAYAQQLGVVVAQQAVPLTTVLISNSTSPNSWKKPRPGLLLSAARTHDIDLPHSWMIGTTADDAQAAAQAGCAGAVIVGGGSVPTTDVGIVVAQAQDLADAPRVMIPRDGGCWHQM